MHRIFRVKAYEQEHGPHFDEVMAHKAVSKMENEDGSRGPHWSIEETTALASQHGISLSNRFNRYDWYVALNMIYSDFYKVIVSISNSNNVRHFIEFAKAWLADKDIDEGKMWYYYVYVMCDKIRKAEMECYEEEVGRKRFDEEEDEDDEFSKYHIGAYRRGGRGRGMRSSMGRRHEYEMDEYEREREREREREEYEPYLVLQFLYLKFMMNLYHRVSSQCLINQEKEWLTLLFNATENRRSSQFQRTDPLLLIIILD